MATKRKDKSRVVLKTGEVQRKDGTYQFSWQDSQMKRRFVYARTLDDLREKEKRIQKDKCDGIKTEARYTTIDELFDLSRGLIIVLAGYGFQPSGVPKPESLKLEFETAS